MSLYAVMTSDLRVMRVMHTEKGAKKYATKRGLSLVGMMDSPTSVSKVFRKRSIWGGMKATNGASVTRYGWGEEWASGGFKGRSVTVIKGHREIALYFKGATP